jgi:ABC-type thiamin/hydroxymethylpyrimidine transport system permease subunit
MSALRGLAASAVLGALGGVLVLAGAAAAAALVLVVYWDQRILVLSLYTAVFGLGGALVLVVARVRASDYLHLTVLGIGSALLSFALRALRAER